MKVNIKTLNALIKNDWSGNTVITEEQYFPKFEYVNGEFIQSESYQIKYDGDKPSLELSLTVEKYLRVELVWEQDVIPLKAYEK